MNLMREVITAPLPGLDLRQHYGHYQSPAIFNKVLSACSGSVCRPGSKPVMPVIRMRS